MGAPKLAFQPDEILFLKQNFYTLINTQLRYRINEYRATQNQLSCSAFRSRCYKMGLKRGVQIRWNNADVKKLKAWYRIMGNTQIAELLNLYGTSSRKIKGKIVKRVFTKKNVEKKLHLLCIVRTEDNIKNIIKDHHLCGNIKVFSSSDNLWTNGVLTPAKENCIKIWKGSMNIKIDGKFIPYARWFYKNFVGSIPDNKRVYHIDMDPMNNSPENLYLMAFQRLGSDYYERALPLIEQRISNIQKLINKKWERLLNKDERSYLMKELSRLINIKNKIEKRITRTQNNQSKYYEPIEAF